MKLVRHGAALAALIAACAVAPPSSAAVTTDNFLLRTTQDLAELCGAQRSDPQGVAAIHECQGFLVGIYQYHEALAGGRGQTRVFCLPAEGAPNRDTAAQMFVAWSRTHQQFMNERPVDGVARWAVETWPCRRATRAPRRPAAGAPAATTPARPASN